MSSRHTREFGLLLLHSDKFALFSSHDYLPFAPKNFRSNVETKLINSMLLFLRIRRNIRDIRGKYVLLNKKIYPRMYLLSYLKETILDNDPSCNDKIMILKEKRNTRFTVFNPR